MDAHRVPMKEKLQILTMPSKRGVSFEENITQYWLKKKLDPELEKVIALALSAPASQVTVERAFSVLPLLLTDRNTKLTDEYVQKNSYIKINLK